MVSPTNRSVRGFTLVELAVVVVILGVLAAFGVPRFMDSVERSKASEAFTFLSTVQQAQERYQARQGTYASTLDKLDIALAEPEYFSVGKVVIPAGGNLETSWQVTLARKGAAAGYGTYTIVYNQDGYDVGKSSIPDAINPRQTGSSSSSSSTSSSEASSGSTSGSSSGATSGSSSGGSSSGSDGGGSDKKSKDKKEKENNGKAYGKSDGKGNNG